ncbi:pol-like protein [Triplophysa rosa]|uniref:Pol-like protein n=1 Tax=Triplophysa rosa TaxID=992332 RepID=A0A9W7TS85_TRIRA|nr:pol-like protein [Triplophysa rosa]
MVLKLHSIIIFLKFCVFFCLLETHNHMSAIRIVTLNLNGARCMQKRALFFELIRQKNIDVTFVQETNSDSLNEIEWRKEWQGEVYLTHISSGRGGVAILFAKNFLPISCEIKQVIPGRLLALKAKFEKFNFIFLNLYAPVNGPERVLFLRNVDVFLQGCESGDYLFLGGDFNCTENDVLDRNHLEPHNASSRVIRELMQTHILNDVWRGINGNDRHYTWTHTRENFISLARLDRFYCFRYHFIIVKKCVISPVGFSDHCLVLCEVFIANVKSRSAYWHFNVSLLEDIYFKDVFSKFWEKFKFEKNCYRNLRQWWDCGKVNIKILCQQYAFNVSRDITRSIRELESEIINLQNLVEAKREQRFIDALKGKKSALVDLLGTRTQGAFVRSRFQMLTQMDAPSRFFFGLERKNGQSRFMHSIRSETGQELNEPADIRRRAVQFYAELYRDEHKENKELSASFYKVLFNISKDSKKKLDKPLSGQELLTALKDMKPGKVPGIDGLPVEFYKKFWGVLGDDFLDVLNESLVEGSLPLSCRRAVVTLLPKKGDLQEIKNWRPVSLLCSDLKIFSKVLANRLKDVMGQIIHFDQTYCVPGRAITDNISLVRDILDVSTYSDLDSGLVSIDQEKAFDRIEHQYLWDTLEAFGFGSVFSGMIKLMYQDIESILKINGGLSSPFKIGRGIRQGCAISGMLYSLAIEPMLNTLRSKIEGFKFCSDNVQHQISAYADDVMVFINSQNDVNNLISTVHDFGVISSAKVNWVKSDALICGKWMNGVPTLPGGLIWKKGGIKYLGVYLGDASTQHKNWDGIMEKMEGRLQKWKWIYAQLSFRGRVLITNNLIASALWHKLWCVDPPTGLLSKLQAKLVDFFWDKLHWVPQGVLFLPVEEGGQGLVSFLSRHATFRLQFIQRLLTGPVDLVWRDIAKIILQRVDGIGLDSALFLVDTNKVHMNGLSTFYQKLLKIWGSFNTRGPENTDSLYWLLEEPLVKGGRLDITEQVPGLSQRLCDTKTVKLGHIVKIAGPELNDVSAVASLLGLKSLRCTSKIMELWSKKLTNDDLAMLKRHKEGILVPNIKDLFPIHWITPVLKDMSGQLLNVDVFQDLDLNELNGRTMYKCFVKLIHKTLCDKTDNVWRDKLGLGDGIKPYWRLFYKPPLMKKSGDLQWKILKGAVGVNSFVSNINPNTSDVCAFCGFRETIFHCFLECSRLEPLFNLLGQLFLGFGENFTPTAFILGACYKRNQRFKWQLINFMVGQAKMAMYISRKNKMNNSHGTDVLFLFKGLIKSRISVEFKYYKGMKDLDMFVLQWCFNEAFLCCFGRRFNF